MGIQGKDGGEAIVGGGEPLKRVMKRSLKIGNHRRSKE